MDILKGLKEIEEALFNNIEIDLSAINLTEGQRYVLDLDTKERVTAFSCFINRREGQTWGILLKAIQLSNEGNKEIVVVNRFMKMSKCAFTSFLEIMEYINQSHKIISARSSSNQCYVVLSNGSRILFTSINESSRGRAANYVLSDNTDLYNQELLNIMVATTLNDKNGQVFIFPQIDDRRERYGWQY